MNPVLAYVCVFFASLAVDLIPFFGPPAWVAMVFFMLKFELNPWLVLAVGVPGSVLGRYVLSRFVPKISDHTFKRQKTEELRFVGRKLEQTLWRSWLFVVIYSLLPMSTTALFSAAGMARVSPRVVIPPFFVGKAISDAVMLFSGKIVLTNLHDVGESMLSAKSISLMVLGLVTLSCFLFLDWRVLLEKHRLRFNFRIWK